MAASAPPLPGVLAAALDEVLAALAPYRRANPFACDLFASSRDVWHVPAARQRQLARAGYAFSSAPQAVQRSIWRHLWLQAPVLEVRLQCLWPLLGLPVAERMAYWGDIAWYGRRLDNWCESDYLSAMVADALEHSPARVLPVLSAWNRHPDPWRRRQSLVGLFYYQRLRRRQPPCAVVLAHLEPHLAAPEHYVQKAVGWTLREAWQVYPQALERWLQPRLTRVQSGAWRTLLEKVPVATARRWRQRRRR